MALVQTPLYVLCELLGILLGGIKQQCLQWDGGGGVIGQP